MSAEDAEEKKHSALVGYMSVPLHPRVPIRRSTFLMAVLFVGFGTLLYLYPPASTGVTVTSNGNSVAVIPGVTPPVTTTTLSPTTTTPPPSTTTTSPSVTTRPGATTTSTTGQGTSAPTTTSISISTTTSTTGQGSAAGGPSGAASTTTTVQGTTP